jgi:hypothetical protein
MAGVEVELSQRGLSRNDCIHVPPADVRTIIGIGDAYYDTIHFVYTEWIGHLEIIG